MTDDNSNPVDMDDLSAFENALFEREQKAEEPAVDEEENVEDEALDEEVDENEDDDSLATDEDEDADLEDEDEVDEEPEPQPKAKRKNPTQTRIEQLVTEARTAERERDALRRELESLRAEKEVGNKEEDVPLKDKLEPGAPKPDAVNEKGNPVYPLGEFDPQYIQDLSLFSAKQTVEKLLAEEKAKAEAERYQKELVVQQEALKTAWNENVERAEEALPDIRDKLAGMADAFEGIDPTYGEYLAGTIMSCDYGPEIMYYLSQNIGEAQKIVASGPAAATLAIGRLEARFMTKEEDVKRNKKRVSDAPKPPEQRARGQSGRFSARPDTDDLDAFERDFFGRK